MKRALVFLTILLVAALVAAERVPSLRARVPWLPRIPGLSREASLDSKTRPDGEEVRGRNRGSRFADDGPVPVRVAAATYADFPVTAEVLGTVQALNSVVVRAQVDGKLIDLPFKEGRDVKKGDVIARIDPASFQAAYDQTLARKAQDEATLANQQADLARYQRLVENQYASRQQADTQKALVAQTTAQIRGDQAAIDSARTTLDYTTVRAPIDGRTGIRQVDVGNIIHAVDLGGIVTIAQIRPIAAIFNLPQQWLRQVNAAAARGTLKLEALDGADGSLLDTGSLDVVDNIVDQTTGTVKLKGSFPNAEAGLWPGEFVNLRLTVDTLAHVVTVPTPAVQRGPDGAFVYVLRGDTAQLTRVTVGRQTERASVISAGLDLPAEVVVTGFNRLTDGAKVTVSPPGLPGPSPAAQAPVAGGAPSEAGRAPPAPDGSDRGKNRGRRRDAAAQDGDE
ncbi:MAG: efflux RND transporter periplasmic adaptor subunit [Parafilimonas terrae]|nr:efflux RND transporter periplasmic adaptor subunit [Parafilimonas terrae]